MIVNNPEQTREILERYQINIHLDDSALPARSYWQKTLFGQRSVFKDKLQLYGFLWAATQIDTSFPAYDPPPTEFAVDDIQFQDTLPPLNHDELTYSVLESIMQTSEIPILLINEPMMHSPKSETRYNLRYPRWAYDAWHSQMQNLAEQYQWNYLDLGDKIPSPDFYTDSAFHLKPEGVELLASYVIPTIRVVCR